MGWSFRWVSTAGSDFNATYGVSFTDAESRRRESGTYNYRRGGHFAVAELPGISVFYRDPAGQIFHTYSTYGRGLDMLNVAYHYLDLVPKGRDEGEGAGPGGCGGATSTRFAEARRPPGYCSGASSGMPPLPPPIT